MLNNIALITIIQNGNEFFKIWYKYYTQLLPEKNIYVIDYNSTDGSTNNINCNIIKYADYNVENIPQGNQLINDLKSELLKTFDYVIYTDYDEIMFHPKGLESVIASKEKYYTTSGYEIVQNRRLEAPINFNLPLIPQRNYWYRCPTYDKPLITSIDFTWAFGNHSASIRLPSGRQAAILQPNYVANLYLLHLHKIDYTHCLALNQKNIAEKKEPKLGGTQNFLIGKKFEDWWKQAETKLVPIPLEIKTRLLL